jgi:oligosaccharide repeat unit polymerase
MNQFIIHLAGLAPLTALTAFCYAYRRSIASPDVLIGAVWVLLYVIHILTGFGFYATWSEMLIVPLVFAFQFGAFLIVRQSQPESAAEVRLPYVRTILVVGALCSLASLGLYLHAGGVSLGTIAGGGIAESARELTGRYYRKELDGDTALGKSLQAISFAAAFLAGIFRGALPGKGKHNWWMAVTLLPCVLRLVLTTNRNSLLIPLLNYAVGYGTGRVWSATDGLFRPAYLARKLLLIAPVLSAAVIVPAFVRWDKDSAQAAEALDKMRIWSAGYLPAFAYWYDFVYERDPGEYEHAMVRPFLEQLKVVEAETDAAAAAAGFFPLDYLDFTSNCPTVMRSVIGQFGLLGGLVFMSLAGAALQIAYYRCRAGGPSAAAFCAVGAAIIVFGVNSYYLRVGARILGSALLIAYFVAVTLHGRRAASKPSSSSRLRGLGEPPARLASASAAPAAGVEDRELVASGEYRP